MPCDYCGNNPVPHHLVKGQEALSIITAPFDRLAKKLGLRKIIDPLTIKLLPGIINVLEKIKVVSFNDDINKVLTKRSKVIWQEAKNRGIKMQQLVIFGRKSDFYRAEINGKLTYFESLPIPLSMATESQDWLDDKVKLKEKLLAAGLPASRGGGFKYWKEMLKVFRMLRKPVIIKPALGSRGRHTTTYIYNEDQLKKAFKVGKQIADKLVMEEHLFGSVYRGTIVNGKLVGVLRGDPPRITGNGVSNIKELVEIKNKNKHSSVHDVVLTGYIEEFLARNNYTPETVLPKGKTIDLLEKIGIGYGGYKAEEIEITHPKTKEILERVGALIDAPVMGFDFIIPDITADPDNQFWGIIECSSLPFIDLHHFPLEGKPINVAGHIWDLWGK